jgi:hypothetical protein
VRSDGVQTCSSGWNNDTTDPFFEVKQFAGGDRGSK